MQPPRAQVLSSPWPPEAPRREQAGTTAAQAIAVQALPARQRFALSESSLASPHASGGAAQARMSSLLKEVRLCTHRVCLMRAATYSPLSLPVPAARPPAVPPSLVLCVGC